MNGESEREEPGLMDAMNSADPFGIGKATLEVWRAMLSEPDKLVESQKRFAQMWLEILERSAERVAGDGTAPVIEPDANDKRFQNPAWTENPALDAMKQAYLLMTQAFLSAIDATDVEPAAKRRAKFFAKQFCDMMSPTNVAFLNPDVVEETMRTGGQNLVEGLRNLAKDQVENQGRVALVDTQAFKVGENVGTTPGKVVFRNELLELIRYDTTTETVYKRPLVIVPPWINKYYILDLQQKNSFVKHATDAGFQTFVVSWRNPDASMAGVAMSDYVTKGALVAAQVAGEIAGSNKVTMNGYCIGGTLLAMLMAYLKRKPAAEGDPVITAATYMASLVDFKEPGEIVNFLGEDALAYIEGKMSERGYLEGSEMADTFTMLRANDLIWTPAVNRYLLGKDAPAFDLLYWNNDSTRMPAAMHSYYLRHMYLANELIEPGALEVDGVPIDLGAIDQPIYIIATKDDHIAPWRSVYTLTQLVSGPCLFRLANSGHIAGIVNPPGGKKAQYWASKDDPKDPDEWLLHAKLREGSWWPDWYEWLGAQSGKRQAPPAANEKYPALENAPGSYVLVK
ncbi:MAG: class I poly(R)-hydroxyalkanoic acid synthase [Candidatus Eremiobacteraeota bacterium]|nr:class I poly(R)-hydroxyalkanoic acid synthase [Candidatus Eremiobacteraeota bacterium]